MTTSLNRFDKLILKYINLAIITPDLHWWAYNTTLNDTSLHSDIRSIRRKMAIYCFRMPLYYIQIHVFSVISYYRPWMSLIRLNFTKVELWHGFNEVWLRIWWSMNCFIICFFLATSHYQNRFRLIVSSGSKDYIQWNLIKMRALYSWIHYKMSLAKWGQFLKMVMY